MKQVFICAFLLITFSAFSQTGEKNFIDQNYMEVTGKSELKITPNIIVIAIQLSEKDNKTKTPLADREKAMISKLKEIGIDVNKDLLIKDMASNFKYYLLSKSDILLSKDYQLIVKDGNTAGRVFIELEKLGISNVNIDRVDHTDIEKFRKEVKMEAIKAAKAKASFLAEAIGQTAGRAIYILELENSYRGEVRGTANSIILKDMKLNNFSEAALPDIEFEKITLEYSILCRFELK